MNGKQNLFVYIGNWDRSLSAPRRGFGICRFDPETGSLALIAQATDLVVDGAFVDPGRGVLYCTDQWRQLPKDHLGCEGRVFAFAIDPATGALTEINRSPSYGSVPCSLAVDGSGAYLVVAHHTDRAPITKVLRDDAGKYRTVLEYDDATTTLFRLNPDGSIGEVCDVFQHKGDGGPLPQQTHPELHSVSVSPDGALFAVSDRGNELIHVFRIDREAGKLVLCSAWGHPALAGSSPRTCAFHPTRPYLYVNHETRAVVSAFHYTRKGQLSPVCIVDALPEGCADDPHMMQSDIKVHPSGKYLYTLIRGIHAVSVFEIDEETGNLAQIQVTTLDGEGPRGCAISPDGRFLLIAALESREVLVWRIGGKGTISPTGMRLSQPDPANLAFWSR